METPSLENKTDDHKEPETRVTFLNRLRMLPPFYKKIPQGEKIEMWNDWFEKHGLYQTNLSDSELKILSQCLLRQNGLKKFGIWLGKPQVYPLVSLSYPR